MVINKVTKKPTLNNLINFIGINNRKMTALYTYINGNKYNGLFNMHHHTIPFVSFIYINYTIFFLFVKLF